MLGREVIGVQVEFPPTLVNPDPSPEKDVALMVPFTVQLPVVETLSPMRKSAPDPAQGKITNAQKMPKIKQN